MAFDLRAVLRLDGNQFVSGMRQVERATRNAERAVGQFRDQNGRLRDGMGRFVRDSNNVSNSMSRLGRAFISPIRAVGSLTSGLNGLVGAYAAVRGAQKAFEETVGAAAKYEQSTVTISAILNDKKLGKQYMDLVDKFAIDSPIMNSQDMLANSKSFLTSIGSDMEQLEQAWSLAERMAAIDPYQGTEGAVFALREMFSGDAISMVRRFEFPRAVMNEIKKMDIPDQLKALDKYFNQIGMTQKLIEDMGGTTLGLWAQIKEQSQVIFRNIGMPALQSIRDFLSDINYAMRDVSDADRRMMRKLDPEGYAKMMDTQVKIEKFKNIGAKMIKGVVDGFISGATGIAKWVESIQNNPEFQKQTTLSGKVEWVIGDVYARFLEWLDGGGRDKIETVVSDMIQVLIGAIEASIETIMPVAVSVGTAIGNGIINGVKTSVESSWLAQLLDDPSGYAMKLATGGKFNIPKGSDMLREHKEKNKKGRSSSAGLDRVPYNGFAINAHKDEMLLTKAEADDYRRNRRTGGGVVITGNTFNVREDADIDRIGEALANRILMAGGLT